MSMKSRGTLQRRDLKTPWISLLQLLIVINCAKAIDYAAYRTDAIPPGITRDIARTTRGLLEELNFRNVSETHDLQDATEHLLHYGALLRSQILDTFGRLVYEKYDDFSMQEIEALYRIYRETLERRYNIFDIVPNILEDPDTRPTKICSHINRNVRTCLKEISRDCMNVKIHDEPHRDTLSKPALNVTKKIYLSSEIPNNYPKGFSPSAVLELLRSRRLRLTPGLFSGLLHNVRYDNFDDGVRTAERKIVSFLAKESKDFAPIISEYSDSARSVSQLLKNYLGDETIFHGKIARYAAYLAEHVVREVDAVDQNIELLGTIYDNSTINLRYLFELILPNDTVDCDIVEARDYLLREIRSKNIVEKYLRVEKYQQAAPDQLIMEIFGQLRDIGFAVDIVTSLYSHARFWHRSQMIGNLNELLELFDAYENLRGLPNFSGLVKAADRIRNNLQDSRNVTVELLCTRPRSCLRIGLELVFKCATVNEETKIAIESFLGRTARDCSLSENLKIVDESRMSKKSEDEIGIKRTIEKPREIVEKNTKKSIIVDESQTSKKYDIGIDVTTEMRRKIVTNATNNSSTLNNEKIPFNSSTLMDHMTKSFETSTHINDSDYDDDYPDSDETQEKRVKKNRSEILRKTTEVPTTSNTFSSKCNGTKCIERVIKCSGDNCSVDCSGDDCSERGNCTDGRRCAEVKTMEKNCTGNDCPDNTTEIRRDCEGSECIKNSTKIECESDDCSQRGNCTDGRRCAAVKTMENNCTGNDCPDNTTEVHRDCEGSECVKNSTKIECESDDCSQRGNCTDGRRCAAVKTMENNCTGNDCPDNTTEVHRDCEGSECAKNSTKIECESGDCSVSSCNDGNCEGSNATLECKGEKCFGKNNSTVKIGCEGSDCADAEEKLPRHSNSSITQNCTGPDCPKVNCTGENCSVKGIRIVPIECEGKDCSKNSTTCKGDDCSAAKNEKSLNSMSSDEASGESDCTGDSCEDYYMTIKCEGSDCPESSMESCEGSDCDNIDNNNDSCNGDDCTDDKNKNDCEGSDCSIEKKSVKNYCKGKNCSKTEAENVSCTGKNCPINVDAPIGENKRSENSTNPTVSSIVEGETETKSCPGKNCPLNVDVPIRENKRSENSTAPSVSSLIEGEVETISCSGKNCPINVDAPIREKKRSGNSTDSTVSTIVEEETETELCSGKNCPTKVDRSIREKKNSTDSSVPLYDETEEKTESCRGENCPNNIEPLIGEKRSEKNSTETSVPSLVEGESKTKFCSGKNCSINGESPIRKKIPTENSTNSSVSSSPVTPILVANRTKIFCDNSDPHYRRKLNRLRKMRRIDANSSRSRAETWGAIFASSRSVGERAEANMKSEINKKIPKKNPLLRVLGNLESNFRLSKRNNSEISRELIRDRAINDTASRSHRRNMSYEKLRVANRKKLGEREYNIRSKLTIEKIGNESSEEETKMRVKKIRKKSRKNRKRTGERGKGKVRIKTTMIHDKDEDEDNEEIRSKRREAETTNRAKKLHEKMRKNRGGRYRIKTTLVKDVSDEDDEVRESGDDSSLEEIIAQRVREQMKKLRQEFRTNSTKLRRGKKFRATRTSRDRVSWKDSRDLKLKDFSTNREKPIRKGIISESKNREESIGRQTESQTDSSDRSIQQRVPLRRHKKKYRHKEYIDKNNDSNELEKNMTITS